MSDQVFTKDDVGKRVWSFDKGWGEICEVTENNHGDCIIIVRYHNDERDYNSDGRFLSTDINPSLFWDEIKFEIPPRPKKKVMRRYWLWSILSIVSERWIKRDYYMDEDGLDTCHNTEYHMWEQLKKIKHENEFIDIEVEE